MNSSTVLSFWVTAIRQLLHHLLFWFLITDLTTINFIGSPSLKLSKIILK